MEYQLDRCYEEILKHIKVEECNSKANAASASKIIRKKKMTSKVKSKGKNKLKAKN